MKEMTGESYVSSPFEKGMLVGAAKEGKTVAEVAWILGAFPWQKNGGIVASPEELHIITFDSDALGKIQDFLTKTVGARKEALKFSVYNMEEDYRKIHTSEVDYDASFYATIYTTLKRIQDKAVRQKAPVVLFSSLTGAASGILRGLSGGVKLTTTGEGDPTFKKSSMDENKWAHYAMQLNEIRNAAQVDKWHCMWEAHLITTSGGKDEQGNKTTKESLGIMGREGVNWPYNVSHVYRFRRKFGQKYEGTKLDKVVLEPRPNLEFIAGGRGFTEFLEPQEPDMAEVFRKLGLKTGGFQGRTSAVQVQVKSDVKKLNAVSKVVKPQLKEEE